MDSPVVRKSSSFQLFHGIVTHFYGQGAVYGKTPVSEEAVLAVLKQYRPRPVNVYIPSLQLPSPGNERLELEDDADSDGDY
jgi:hypothetical protein